MTKARKYGLTARVLRRLIRGEAPAFVPQLRDYGTAGE
jgi:hypothetical protein